MQGPAIRIAHELGFYTVVVDGSSAAPCITLADKFEQIDLKDKEGIEAFARSLRDSGLGGIMTAGTDFSATVAWVAERLGLPGIPYEAALNASDKARMRSCFQKAGLPSPEYTIITEAGLPNYSLFTNHYSLVIKPVDNMGGRGCCRVDSREEFQAAAADALRFSRSGRAIVEAFMDGPEFSVDAIVYHGEITICGLADRHIFFPPYFIEMGHTMPTAITPKQQAAILETFCAGVRALGLADTHSIGAAKGDIKLTPQGPMIGEIAARLSGGYMSGWTYPYASGVEPVRAAILAAMGRKPEGLAPLKNWTSAERAFISIPGTVKAISGIEKARGLPHVRDLFLRVAEGDKVDFPRNNVSKCGNIISAAPDRAAAVVAAESAARSILIRLDPSDTETAIFLSSTNHYPLSTNHYFLNNELQAALAALPETTNHYPLSTNHYPPTNHFPLIAFPAFVESDLRDYMGRTVTESLEAIRELTGFSFVFVEDPAEIPPESVKSSDNRGNLLGKSFWAALARGGYQGAVYYIDQWGRER
jgi:biotin carboxylase